MLDKFVIPLDDKTSTKTQRAHTLVTELLGYIERTGPRVRANVRRDHTTPTVSFFCTALRTRRTRARHSRRGRRASSCQAPYQSDCTSVPPCSVCALHWLMTPAIVPKSPQDFCAC